MKHLLNNLSEEEKNSIREQHEGGMKIINENFHKMVSKKLGDVDLYINEQQSTKVLGPFKHQNIYMTASFGSNTVYVVKLDRDACMAGSKGLDDVMLNPEKFREHGNHIPGTLYPPTNGKCADKTDTFLPGNKYYISQKFGKSMHIPNKRQNNETFML